MDVHENRLPSGNLLQFAIENMVISIVDLAIQNGDFPSIFHSYVSLLEGNGMYS